MTDPANHSEQANSDTEDTMTHADAVAVAAAENLGHVMTEPAGLLGEPVWQGPDIKKVTVHFEGADTFDIAYLGEADRPSAVARLLRQAADDIETTVTEQLRARPAGEART